MEYITYLLANYNNAPYIEECIASLQAQTSNKWYCLIADDKSTDNSVDIIKPLLNEQIKLIENSENIGKVGTLKRLIDHTSTDIIGILDPDDTLCPTVTELVLEAYKKNPETGFVYTNLTFYDKKMEKVLKPGRSTPVHAGRDTLIGGGFVDALRTFRISAYRETAGYDDAIIYAEDRDLVYKMEEVTPFVFIDQPLYNYRQVPKSQTHEPKKRRIGITTHRIAYKNALRRRNIRGLRRVLHLFYFNECYSEHPLIPKTIVPLGHKIKRFLIRLWSLKTVAQPE